MPSTALQTPLPAHGPRPGMGDAHGGVGEHVACNRYASASAAGPELPVFHTATPVHCGCCAAAAPLHRAAHWGVHSPVLAAEAKYSGQRDDTHSGVTPGDVALHGRRSRTTRW